MGLVRRYPSHLRLIQGTPLLNASQVNAVSAKNNMIGKGQVMPAIGYEYARLEPLRNFPEQICIDYCSILDFH